jgi:hypothetical protein
LQHARWGAPCVAQNNVTQIVNLDSEVTEMEGRLANSALQHAKWGPPSVAQNSDTQTFHFVNLDSEVNELVRVWLTVLRSMLNGAHPLWPRTVSPRPRPIYSTLIPKSPKWEASG